MILTLIEDIIETGVYLNRGIDSVTQKVTKVLVYSKFLCSSHVSKSIISFFSIHNFMI